MVCRIGFLSLNVVGVRGMPKDWFGRHTPIRSAGFKKRIRVMDDCSFCLVYKRSDLAKFIVTYDFDSFSFPVSLWESSNLSFCLACGRFIGFGAKFGICWICEDNFEVFEDDEFDMDVS